MSIKELNLIELSGTLTKDLLRTLTGKILEDELEQEKLEQAMTKTNQ